MTTSAPDREAARRLRELDERKLRAWHAYRDSLRDLQGSEYDEVEARAWDRLQRKLGQLEDERREIVGDAPRDHASS